MASNVSSSPIVTGFEGVFTEIDNDGPVGRATDSVEKVLVLGLLIGGLLSGILSSDANGEDGKRERRLHYSSQLYLQV